MRIWRFTDPSDYRFAEGGRRGSWTQPSEGLCPECTASPEERTRPLILAWLPGSDTVGDFVWPGFDSEVVVTDDVLGALQSRFHGFEPGPVEMVEEKGVRARKRGDRQVRLPYHGPRLHELWVTAWAHLDPGRSSVELERRCGTCRD